MATEAWFDYDVYMANKLAQMKSSDPSGNWNMDKLVTAFNDAGFMGAEGAQQHFLLFGANEDVAPNVFFDATEYYEAKAAEFYGKSPKDVTDLDTANIKAAIHNAGMNAWTHYTQFGSSEGVNPSNAFNTSAYMEAKLAAMQAAEPDKGWTMEMLNKAFQDAGLSALEHFALFGGKGAGEVAETYDPSKMPDAYAVPEDQKVRPSGGGNNGETYTLTAETDIFTGTAANDAFVAPDTGNLKDKATLNAADQLDGGAGTDTLTLYGNDNLKAFGTADIKNIEIVKAVGVGDNVASAINADAYADVQEVWVDRAAGATTVNALASQKVVYTGTVGGTATVSYSGTDTAADAATVGLNAAAFGASALEIDATGSQAIETLTLELTGANTFAKQVVDNIIIASADSLIFTGKGSLKAGITGETGKLASVDASANTGGVDLLLQSTDLNTDGATLKGGAGDDRFVFDGKTDSVKFSADLGAGDDTLMLNGQNNVIAAAGSAFNGGDGTDTLIIDGGGTALNGTDTAVGKMFTGFETLQVQGTTTYKMGAIAGITNYVVADDSAATGTTATFTNVADKTSFLVTAHDAQEDTLTATLASNTDPAAAVSLVLDNGAKDPATGASLKVDTNAHYLNLASEGNLVAGKSNAVSLITDSLESVTKVIITGDSASFLTTNATTALSFIDASASAGNVTVNANSATLTGGTTNIMSILTGSGRDVITAATDLGKTSRIDAGKGADIINLKSTNTSKNAENTIVIKAGDSNIDGFDFVTNFNTGDMNADVLDLSAFNFTNRTVGTLAESKVDVSGAYDRTAVMGGLNVSVKNGTGFFSDAGGAHSVMQFEIGGTDIGHLLLFIDANKDGNWDAGDQVVLLGAVAADTTLDADHSIHWGA